MHPWTSARLEVGTPNIRRFRGSAAVSSIHVSWKTNNFFCGAVFRFLHGIGTMYV